MKLSTAIKKFVREKQLVGLNYDDAKFMLEQFSRFSGDIELDCITNQNVVDYVYSGNITETTQAARFQKVKKFLEWAVNREFITRMPITSIGPKIQKKFIPYIYSREELKRLFSASGTLDDRSSPLQGKTLKMLLVTIYACGLRLGEAIDLRICDVNLAEQKIIVLESKFRKTRILPIGETLCNELQNYLKLRRSCLLLPKGKESSFFASRTGHNFCTTHIDHTFQRIRNLADIAGINRKIPPRIHDLRHTYAVHKLMEWYRAGENVNDLLPYLSTYMGHKDLEDTKVYLTMTREFLSLISDKYETYVTKG